MTSQKIYFCHKAKITLSDAADLLNVCYGYILVSNLMANYTNTIVITWLVYCAITIY